jgi:N-methylhydantoinase A
MQSNGGALPARLIRRHAVRTLLSGPAGGITAAKFVAGQLGLPNLVTFDMGGTSTDVCLITGGRAGVRSDTEIGGLPIRVPMLDIVTVGAGGGSIASVDSGGKLRVGPQSAGAVPGPACYGRGGKLPTITDANVVAGVIGPDALLAGAMTVRRDLAEAACAGLGERLGTAAAGAAAAILEVANATMRGALRLVSTERGVDPADYWLLSYGGAGGQHAVMLADDLGFQGVVVPRLPGLFSAFGLLIADIERDWSASLTTDWPLLTADALKKTILDVCEQARTEFADAGLSSGEIGYEVVLAVRYRGQAFEVDVPLEDWAGPIDLAEVAEAFHVIHERRYGHATRSAPVELVTVRVKAILPRQPALPSDRAPGPNGRPEDIPGHAHPGAAYVHRDGIVNAVEGPAVIEEETSTTWVPAGWTARAEEHGHLMITRSERG